MSSSLQRAWAQYYPPVREKCRRVLTEDHEADDVAQETFIKFWQAEVRETDPERVIAWLYCTATRACLDRLRRRRVRVVEPAMEHLAPDVEQAFAQRQTLAQLASTAPAEEWEAAVLSRVDRMTQLEIAQVLDLSERTVRRLLARFDERIAQLAREESP